MREFSGQAVEEIIFTSLRLALLERGVKSSCRVEDSPPYEWRASISNEVLSKYFVERISLDGNLIAPVNNVIIVIYHSVPSVDQSDLWAS